MFAGSLEYKIEIKEKVCRPSYFNVEIKLHIYESTWLSILVGALLAQLAAAQDLSMYPCIYLSICLCVYIYIYIEREI